MSNITGNDTSANDLLAVLLTVKKNIMTDTNVAEICKVLSITNDEIKVSSINKNEQLLCVKLMNLNVSVNDIVLVVFTNTDYRTNLRKIKAGQVTQPANTVLLHSSNYGVIVGIIYKGGA